MAVKVVLNLPKELLQQNQGEDNQDRVFTVDLTTPNSNQVQNSGPDYPVGTSQGLVNVQVGENSNELRSRKRHRSRSRSHSRGRSRGRSRGKSRGRSRGRSRGHSRGRSRGHSRGRSRGHSRGKSREHSRGKSRGRSREHFRDRSRGRSRGKSRGHSREKSRGHSRLRDRHNHGGCCHHKHSQNGNRYQEIYQVEVSPSPRENPTHS